MASLPRVFARDHRPVSTVGLLVRFAGAGLIVLLSLAAAIAFIARQAGVEQATESARQAAYVTARAVVEPQLTPQALAGDPAALSRLNDAVRRYGLQGSLVRVKIWNADGRIVYSDESRLIGRTYPLGEEESEALRSGGSDSEVSDLSQPENSFEVPYGKLLEVYTGIRSTTGQQVLFEAYFRYDAVTTAGQAAWRSFAPPALGALLVLELVQIPFAWSLARRVQRQQRERERLLRHAVDASDAERRRIAGDLHDGVVQELTGMSYAMDAMRRLGQPTEDQRATLIADSAGRLRESIGSLRSLLVDLYPPNLAEEGLPSALTELADGLQRTGIDVRLDVDGTENLPHDTAALLFRAAQEILRNVATHSGAREVLLRAAYADGTATLVVDDDGRGFDQGELDARGKGGHFGLRSIGDLLADSGGMLTVRAAPGQGTRVEVEVPVS